MEWQGRLDMHMHTFLFHHTSPTKLKLENKIAKNSMMVTAVHRIMGVSFLA